MDIATEHLAFFTQVAKLVDPKITDEELAFLVAGLRPQQLKKKTIVVSPYKVHRDIGFVAQGLVRGYYVDQKGEEITTRLVDRGNFVTQYSAFLQQTPSAYYFQCIEDTHLLSFNFEHIQEGYQKFPGLHRFGRLIAESIILTLENRVKSFHFLSAEERYLQFLEQFPELVNRVSLSYLSTYLGITRPSLSRIRGNLSRTKSL